MTNPNPGRHLYHAFCLLFFPAFLLTGLIGWLAFGISVKKSYLEVLKIGWNAE